MGEWGFLGGLFDSLQAHSPMLGRFWLLLMLIFRIVILGTVASDLFEDEQEEFACNTLQPGCKQVCYDMAFPISQYRFWVFHIVLIATPSLLFLVYTMHHHNKKNSKFNQRYNEDIRLRRLYIVNVVFRILAEVGFLVGQWLLYGFKVEAQFPCSRFPCPYTVDCFTSRPAEKTVFLCFYFVVGAIAAFFSCAELFHSSIKWFCCSTEGRQKQNLPYISDNLLNLQEEETAKEKRQMKNPHAPNSVRQKRGSAKSISRKSSSGVHRHIGGKVVSTRTFTV
ncbi:gap junction delta-3 protein-like [Takifugu flavidus]|uniref:Gap junction delta-3 protein n=1 Tax=Takifugu flavidus TaxID=433684 RepID=A0A5C6PP35_9TELE|nr:gap junction delta-3 protein-like [Takifugu flavidus]TWW81454.1 Gap junction delta-3 protein [Takifugu flavidus]